MHSCRIENSKNNEGMHKFSTSPTLSLKLLRSQRQQKHSTAGTRAAYCNALAFGKNSRPPRSRRSFRNRSSGHRSFVVWSQFTHAAPQVRFRATFRRRCTLTPSPKHRRVTSRLCQPTLSHNQAARRFRSLQSFPSRVSLAPVMQRCTETL